MLPQKQILSLQWKGTCSLTMSECGCLLPNRGMLVAPPATHIMEQETLVLGSAYQVCDSLSPEVGLMLRAFGGCAQRAYV
jgi:hypothetical protein